MHGLVVRSPIAAARDAGDSLDLARLAREGEVDTVLLAVPGDALIWSDVTEITEDLFRLAELNRCLDDGSFFVEC